MVGDEVRRFLFEFDLSNVLSAECEPQLFPDVTELITAQMQPANVPYGVPFVAVSFSPGRKSYKDTITGFKAFCF